MDRIRCAGCHFIGNHHKGGFGDFWGQCGITGKWYDLNQWRKCHNFARWDASEREIVEAGKRTR